MWLGWSLGYQPRQVHNYRGSRKDHVGQGSDPSVYLEFGLVTPEFYKLFGLMVRGWMVFRRHKYPSRF